MSGVSDVFHSAPTLEPSLAEIKRAAEPVQPVEQDPPVSHSELEQAVTMLNQVISPLDLSMSIRFDEAIQQYRVKIVHRQTNELIREIPARGVLEAARQAARGLFVDQLS